jgi:hypothetical protein
MTLRDVSELLYPAVYATVMSLGVDLGPDNAGGKDSGMAKAALVIARTIDEADPKDRRHAIRDCMPELRQILEALGGSPAARAAISKGAKAAGSDKPKTQLDILREQRARKGRA